MTAAPHPGPTPSDEQALDELLADIDSLADRVIKKATDRQKKTTSGCSPTQAFSPERFKKTKAAFQQLSQDDATELLEESRDDHSALGNGTDPAPPKKKERSGIWPWKRAATG